jgi:hypothetical protein
MRVPTEFSPNAKRAASRALSLRQIVGMCKRKLWERDYIRSGIAPDGVMSEKTSADRRHDFQVLFLGFLLTTVGERRGTERDKPEVKVRGRSTTSTEQRTAGALSICGNDVRTP